MLAEVHGGKVGQHNVQVSPLRKTIGTGCFHQAVNHSTGFGSFYRVAEQPVLPSHSKGTDGVFGKVIGNLTPGVKQVVRVTPKFCVKSIERRNRAKFICRR